MEDIEVKRLRNLRNLKRLEGDSAFHLECFGDHLAKREGYKESQGIEALRFYLAQKHHWLPSVVKALSYEDLDFLLQEEKSGWTLPGDVVKLIKEDDFS